MTEVRQHNSTLTADPDKRMKRTAMKKRNDKRKRKRAMEGKVYGPYHRAQAAFPCEIEGKHKCGGVRCGHHLKSVGSGGVDHGNEVTLCAIGHRLIHDIGQQAFEERFDVDLNAIAERRATMWDEREGE